MPSRCRRLPPTPLLFFTSNVLLSSLRIFHLICPEAAAWVARVDGRCLTQVAHFVSVQTPTMTISRAMSMMVQGHINRLPVVEDGEVVGILTRYDILRALTRLSSLENIDSSMI